MAELVVSASTARDMGAVTAIYKYFVETSMATSELVSPSEAEMLQRRQVALDRDLPYLVAELEEYVVGFCYASQFRPRAGYRPTVEDSIYVRTDCIGYGVGKRLLTALVEGCRASACHSMIACICGVNPMSVALHSSLGFSTVGKLPEVGCKFGEWFDLTMMQRIL